MKFAELLEAKRKEYEATLKTKSREHIIKRTQGTSQEEKNAVAKYYEAVASGDPALIKESNDLQIKAYEAAGIEWRDE